MRMMDAFKITFSTLGFVYKLKIHVVFELYKVVSLVSICCKFECIVLLNNVFRSCWHWEDGISESSWSSAGTICFGVQL